MKRENVKTLFLEVEESDQVKEEEIGRTCSTNGEKKNASRLLVG
jgi:hypothetical protein